MMKSTKRTTKKRQRYFDSFEKYLKTVRDKGRYLAVGDGGTLSLSEDGIKWKQTGNVFDDKILLILLRDMK